MGNNFRTYNPTQTYLLPPSPTDWLPKDHLAYFLLDVIDALDLSEIEAAYAKKDARGERPYSPRMMLALLLYGYCVGVFSSRKIAKATYEDVAFRVLGGGEHPHFTRIGDFRLHHREALGGLFVDVLKLCERAGLIKLGHVALDGTKILANASKHKAMSYERMGKEEKRLREEIEALLQRADEIDREEDERYGVGREEEGFPEELRHRATRIERIKAAKAELEAEARLARAERLRALAAENELAATDESQTQKTRRTQATLAEKQREAAKKLDGKDDDDEPKGGVSDLPLFRTLTKPDGKPRPKSQRNFTDSDSRIMMKDGAFVQAYNAQIVVDDHAQIIVAHGVTNQPADSQLLPAMLARTIDNLERAPETLTADNGYFSASNVACCVGNGVDPHISLGRRDPSVPRKGELADGERGLASASMAAKLSTPAGRILYAKRKVVAEPPFGQIKAARGFRRFSQRGLDKVRHEWSLVCATHNLLKLFRCGWRPMPSLALS